MSSEVMLGMPHQDVEKAAALFAAEASRNGLAAEEGAKADKAKAPAGRIRFVGEAKVELVVDAASPRVTQEEEILAEAPAAAAPPATDMEAASARSATRNLAFL